jgi:hypothetical protein
MPVKTQNKKLLLDIKRAESHKVKTKTPRINKHLRTRLAKIGEY